MTAAAICAQQGLRIHSPASALFLQMVDANTSLSDCWNYICRCTTGIMPQLTPDRYLQIHSLWIFHQ